MWHITIIHHVVTVWSSHMYYEGPMSLISEVKKFLQSSEYIVEEIRELNCRKRTPKKIHIKETEDFTALSTLLRKRIRGCWRFIAQLVGCLLCTKPKV